MRNKVIEVLAPAGSMISFKAAIAAGADAVYVGGSSFGARAFANNFDEDELLEAIDYAHFHNRKIFLTVNTLLKDNEIKGQLYDYLLPYYKQGLDAVIVQDVGVLELVRECFPDIDIHASTQMTITNTLGAQFLKKQGADRIVPARELSLSEIRQISEDTGLEIECFVHGALCYCYSGQCLLSSMIGGRSGNRGQCAQPCRLPYDADGKHGYLLSPKDICTLDLIPEMIDAGIDSFKIEGRMKKPEYVAAVTSMYRKYVDLYFEKGKKNFCVDPMDKQMLMDIYNRGGFDDGYYKKHNSATMMSVDRPNHAGVPAFRVMSQKNREMTGKAIVPIHKGDILELSREDNYTFGQDIKVGDTFSIIVPKKKRYKKDQVLSRTRNQFILNQIDELYVNRLIKKSICGKLYLSVGKKSRLQLSADDVVIWCEGDEVACAKNQPLSKERVEKQMRKTGNTEYEWKELLVETDGNVFAPIQQLNELRRNGLEQLEKALCERHRRDQYHPYHFEQKKLSEQHENIELALLVQTIEQLNTAICLEEVSRIYIDCNVISQTLKNSLEILPLIECARKKAVEIYFAMPHIFRAEAVQEYNCNYDKFVELAADGVLIRNYESYQFLKNHNFSKSIMLDSNVYVMNGFAKNFWIKDDISEWTTPVELSHKELEKLGVSNGEFIAYGYLPMMISAGCLKKTLGNCNHLSEITILKDRLKNEYRVKNYCDFCYNIMYNDEPLVLYDQMTDIRRMNPKRIRLQFSLEDVDEMKTIITLYQNALLGNQMSEPGFDFTRGHFRRGIR